tara:strand:- start:14022 stop:14216 length:195 start_codon:yes stop_codon:yes gene_type:complete
MVVNEKEGEARRCSYCGTPDGEVRMIGKFVVDLIKIEVNSSIKFACQSCKVKVKEAREALKKNN